MAASWRNRSPGDHSFELPESLPRPWSPRSARLMSGDRRGEKYRSMSAARASGSRRENSRRRARNWPGASRWRRASR